MAAEKGVDKGAHLVRWEVMTSWPAPLTRCCCCTSSTSFTQDGTAASSACSTDCSGQGGGEVSRTVKERQWNGSGKSVERSRHS